MSHAGICDAGEINIGENSFLLKIKIYLKHRNLFIKTIPIIENPIFFRVEYEMNRITIGRMRVLTTRLESLKYAMHVHWEPTAVVSPRTCGSPSAWPFLGTPIKWRKAKQQRAVAYGRLITQLSHEKTKQVRGETSPDITHIKSKGEQKRNICHEHWNSANISRQISSSKLIVFIYKMYTSRQIRKFLPLQDTSIKMWSKVTLIKHFNYTVMELV